METINLDLLYSKEGEVESCKVNNQSLHSKYNPTQEALKVFTQQNIDIIKSQTRIVLIGAGLFYDVQAIRRLSPSTKIIAIYFHKELMIHSQADIALYYNIHNTTQHNFSTTLKQALNRSFQALNNPSHTDINVCYWPTSMRIWQQHGKQCIKNVKEIVMLHNSEINTLRHFLPQWIRNACYHFLHLQSYLKIKTGTKPIVITAAGHSLNNFLSEIQNIREKICLVALSSSLNCLHSNAIVPDIVVHQDSSYYAQRQIHHYFNKNKSLLAMPLSAGRLHAVSEISPILINTNQEMEQLLSFNEGISIPAYATVLGTAIEMCGILSTNDIFLIGADMSIDCASSHCIPHSNIDIHRSHYTHSKEHMLLQDYLDSTHILEQKRFGYPLKQNNALINYAQWFSRWQHNIKKRLTHIVLEKETSLLGLNTACTIPQSVFNNTHTQEDFSTTYVLRNTTFSERVTILQKYIKQWETAVHTISTVSFHTTNSSPSKNTLLLSPTKSVLPKTSLQTLISSITNYIGQERWENLFSQLKQSLYTSSTHIQKNDSLTFP